MSDERVEELLAAVERSPEDHALRLVLAGELRAAGRDEEALDHLGTLLDAGALGGGDLVGAGELAVRHGRLHLAARCLKAARRRGVRDGVEPLQRELEDALTDGAIRRRPANAPSGAETANDPGDVPAGLDDLRQPGFAAPPAPRPVAPADRAAFAEVGGLAAAKAAIHRTIILPFEEVGVYERYGRRAGGGVLLYGPPGCGKTLLARATAGECRLPFFNVRIEDVLDPYVGVSEGNLHGAFEAARAQAPCVLFLDELDAVAYARRKQQGGGARALVDQLLQELDAIGAHNEQLLVLAATNAPWDVDDALKRPGRFDHLVFVPPPDAPAREEILALHLAGRPAATGLDLAGLARRTPLYSGADLRHLVERAVDLAIDETLRGGGGEVPISDHHLAAALDGLGPTTLEWLATARNYVEFANQSGRYDDVLAYLATAEARTHLARRRR